MKKKIQRVIVLLINIGFFLYVGDTYLREDFILRSAWFILIVLHIIQTWYKNERDN